jgi:hypothetical protein
LNYLKRFSKTTHINFHENPSTGATFGMTKLIVTFRNFAKAPKTNATFYAPCSFSARIADFKIVKCKNACAVLLFTLCCSSSLVLLVVLIARATYLPFILSPPVLRSQTQSIFLSEEIERAVRGHPAAVVPPLISNLLPIFTELCTDALLLEVTTAPRVLIFCRPY